MAGYSKIGSWAAQPRTPEPVRSFQVLLMLCAGPLHDIKPFVFQWSEHHMYPSRVEAPSVQAREALVKGVSALAPLLDEITHHKDFPGDQALRDQAGTIVQELTAYAGLSAVERVKYKPDIEMMAHFKAAMALPEALARTSMQGRG